MAEAKGLPAVEYENVSRRFGRTVALDGVNLAIGSGTIHAMVGENGAGKSTCLGLLAGRIGPSSGTIRVFGEELRSGNPAAARAARVAAIYQELTIVPAQSPQANVFLGHPLSRAGVLAERDMRRRYEELCERLGTRPLPASTRTGDLSVADQQLVEIMRALATDARILLFDEPTAALTQLERETVLALMEQLRADGRTVVFVSHNLDEVLQVSDHISVFREGTLVASDPRQQWTKRGLVERMLGDDPAHVAGDLLGKPAARRQSTYAPSDGRPAEPLLKVAGLTVGDWVEDLSFEVAPGEILGIAGIVGSGRSTVLRALAGCERGARGELWIRGEQRPWPKRVRAAQRLGIALLPEDRKKMGIFPALPAADNVVLSKPSSNARLGLIGPGATRAAAAGALAGFNFRDEWLSRPADQLSGGNQQKLLLARWRHSKPAVLLVDEPTRGIDLGAKAMVLESLRKMAKEGMAVVFVSSELEEVAEVAGRILVLANGQKVAELSADEPASASDLLHHAFGSAA